MAITCAYFPLGKCFCDNRIMYYRIYYRRSSSYWFGWVRLAHFIAAFIFVVNFAVRIYWFFAGNSFAKWYNYIPLKKKQWRGIFETIKVDVLLLSPKPVYDIGHNSLAAFTYFGLFIIMAIQTFTGFAMFCVSTNNIFEPFFTWLLFVTII